MSLFRSNDDTILKHNLEVSPLPLLRNMTKRHPLQPQHLKDRNAFPSRKSLQPTPDSISPPHASYPKDLSTSSSLQILPATYDDIPEIADIHIEAYRNDVMVRLEYGDTPIADIKKAMIANMQEQWTKWNGQGFWAIKAVIAGEAVGCAIWGDRRHKRESHDAAVGGLGEAKRYMDLRQAFAPPQLQHLSQSKETGNRASAMDKTNAANAESNLRDTAHAKLMQLHAKWVDDNTRFLCEFPWLQNAAIRQI